MGDSSAEFKSILREMDGRPNDRISDDQWNFGCEVLRSKLESGQKSVAISESCAVVGEPEAVAELYARASSELWRLMRGSKGVCVKCDFGRCDNPKRKGGFDHYRVEVPRSECMELSASPDQLSGAYHMEESFRRLLTEKGIKLGLEWETKKDEKLHVTLTTKAGAYSALDEWKNVVMCRTDSKARMVFALEGSAEGPIVRASLPVLLAAIEGKSRMRKGYEKGCPDIEKMAEAIRENETGGLDITMKSGRVLSITADDVVTALNKLLDERESGSLTD